MAPRLSGQTPIFGASFIVTKCPLGIRDLQKQAFAGPSHMVQKSAMVGRVGYTVGHLLN